MVIDSYYGQKAATTYLEIYSAPTEGTDRVIHRQLKDQEAYDFWHLSLYFKELLEYRTLLERPTLSLSDLPRKEKNLLLYLMLACDPGPRRILELGSSLFELIDGLEVVRQFVRLNNVDLPDLPIERMRYEGIEISELFRTAAPVLHPGYSIAVHPSAKAYEERVDVLYDRSVTNYALESPAELADFLKCAKCGLLCVFFSLGETFQSLRLGKTLTYFALEEFLDLVDAPFFHLFGSKAPGPLSGTDPGGSAPVVEGFFMYGDRDFTDTFMNMAKRDPAVWAYFEEKHISPKDPRELLV